jgi:ABC-type thiamine transport system substrate-binding protein
MVSIITKQSNQVVFTKYTSFQINSRYGRDIKKAFQGTKEANVKVIYAPKRKIQVFACDF